MAAGRFSGKAVAERLDRALLVLLVLAAGIAVLAPAVRAHRPRPAVSGARP
jgi:hypothetical protein